MKMTPQQLDSAAMMIATRIFKSSAADVYQTWSDEEIGKLAYRMQQEPNSTDRNVLALHRHFMEAVHVLIAMDQLGFSITPP